MAGMIGSDRANGAGMSGAAGYDAAAILVRERLEVHRLVGVHFLTEAEQMEGGVRADFVFHAFCGECMQGGVRIWVRVVDGG